MDLSLGTRGLDFWGAGRGLGAGEFVGIFGVFFKKGGPHQRISFEGDVTTTYWTELCVSGRKADPVRFFCKHFSGERLQNAP